MKNNRITGFRGNGYLFIILLWFLFEVIWYLCFGVHFELESEKYIYEARYILQNHGFSQFRYLFYFSTIAVIAFSYAINIGLYGALFIILLINLLSYLYFFKALQRLFTDGLSPYLIIGFLLSFWPYQSWSLYLYTECMFYSAVLLLFAHLILFRRLSFKFLVAAFFILFLLVLSRPLGILFVLPTLLFIFFKLSKRQQLFFYGAVVLFLALMNFVVQVVFTTTSDWNMVRALTEDSIICDMPRNAGNAQLDLSQNPNQLYQLVYYISHNFSHFAGLAVTRLRYFFTMVRSYYSTAHNLYLVVILVVLYGSIVGGIKRIFKSMPVSLGVFIFSSIIMFSMAIAFQCDDYHNRFFLTLVPFLVTMAAVEVVPILCQFIFSLKSRKD
jgi:hypothetical protein